MTAVEKIRERAAKYPGLAIDERPGWISAKPPGDTSFEVGLREHQNQYTVYFDGWHEEVDGEETALNLFAMGLSESVRLAVTSRGRRAYRWTVAFRRDGAWSSGSTTGLLFFPFWKRKTVRYFQNAVIRTEGERVGAAEQRIGPGGDAPAE
jgi:hypothetical protein